MPTQVNDERRHIVTDQTQSCAPPVAGTAAWPGSDLGQGVFPCDALAPLRTSLGRRRAFAPLLQQSCSGLQAAAAARRTRGPTRPQRTGGPGGRGTRPHPPRLKRPRRAARPAPYGPFPSPLAGPLGARATGPSWPRLTANGQGLMALRDPGTGPRRPVAVPCPPGALVRGQIGRERVHPLGRGPVSRGHAARDKPPTSITVVDRMLS